MYSARITDVKRGAVFAHFDRDNIVDGYVVHYLRSLKEICNSLVFVSVSPLTLSETEKIADICDAIIIRDNVGYDFMSYKVGLEKLKLDDFDELVLCNDSVYGPLFPLRELFHRMEDRECDFWGLTESSDISYHLQSYFLVFRTKVLKSRVFHEFWKGVVPLNQKRDIIEHYEIGLSTSFIADGLRPACLTDVKVTSLSLIKYIAGRRRNMQCKTLTGIAGGVIYLCAVALFLPIKIHNFCKLKKTVNKSHFLWKELVVKHKFPFIKVELLRDNPMNLEISDYRRIVKQSTSYDPNLIDRHLDRMQEHG